MAALVVVLVLSIASLALLGVLVVGLFRHVKVLSESLRRFSDEVTPLLEKIREGSSSAQDRTGTLGKRGSSLRRDARIRR